MSDYFFSGISASTYAFWKSSAAVKQEPLTADKLQKAFEHIREWKWRPEREIHSPRCPKILGLAINELRACRCGGAPFEAHFEDMLARTHPGAGRQ